MVCTLWTSIARVHLYCRDCCNVTGILKCSTNGSWQQQDRLQQRRATGDDSAAVTWKMPAATQHRLVLPVPTVRVCPACVSFLSVIVVHGNRGQQQQQPQHQAVNYPISREAVTSSIEWRSMYSRVSPGLYVSREVRGTDRIQWIALQPARQPILRATNVGNVAPRAHYAPILTRWQRVQPYVDMTDIDRQQWIIGREHLSRFIITAELYTFL